MSVSCVLTLSVLLVFVPKLTLQQQCLSLNDLGQTECVHIEQPPYDGHQWSTCLTEDYIMRASGGRYQCYLSSDTQCWYQCMIEIYGVTQGAVNADCSCTPGEMLPNDLSRLAADCYSPRGDDCRWYEDCLERRYPCRGTDDGYAIEYAQKFCNLYSDNYNDFSSDGRRWVDAVRQCLQVALVPSLRLWVTNTCAQIRDHAFATHSGCYTGVTPSMCELGCGDIWLAFVIVNFPEGDFTEGATYTTPVATIRQMLSVMTQCYTNEELSGCISNLVTTLAITVTVAGRSNPIVYSATTALLAARYLSTALNWVENGFSWFPLFDDDDVDTGDRNKRQNDDEIIIRVLLVDTKLLNISNGTMSQPTSGQTLDQAVDEFVDAVMNGSLSMIPLNINNTEVTSSLSTVSQCMDVGCNSTANMTELVVAPTTSPTSSVTTRLSPDPTASVTTMSPSPPTRPSNNEVGGGTEILRLHYLALYSMFAAVILMK